MEMVYIGAAAIVSALIFIIYGRVSSLVDSSTVSAIEKYAKYKPYALIAAKRVEEWIDDEKGVSANASATEKSLHKLDMYLETFINIVNNTEGKAPTQAIIDAAKVWSIDLAEELNYKKVADAAIKEAKEKADGTPVDPS